MKTITGIGRTIDLRYPSNVFVVVATLLTGAFGFFPALGDGFVTAFVEGARTGGSTFLAWAVARELDPDRPGTATVAAGLGFAASFVGDPMLAVCGAALLGARITLRSTGIAPTLVDLVVVIGAVTYAATRTGGYPAAVVVGVALVLERRLPGRSEAWTATAGWVAIVTATVAAGIGGTLTPDFSAISGWGWVLAAGALVGSVSVLRPPLVTSLTDWTDKPLSERRLRAARFVALGIVAGSLVWAGAGGLAASAPVAAAMLGSLVPGFAGRMVPVPAEG